MIAVNNITLIILFISSFLLVHLFKMVRLYLVLIEQKIPFGKFVGIYLETTCINLIVPFKLGEIYRVCRLALETKKLILGLLTVLADRFFDIVSLLLLIFVMRGMGATQGTMTLLILGSVIVIMAVAYLSFPGAYRYLNGYIMKNRHSKKALFMLRTLEGMNEWHEYIQQLVRGRSAFIIIASIMGWIFEGIALVLLARIMNITYGINELAEYIGLVLKNSTEPLYKSYNLWGVGFLAGLLVVFLVIRFLCTKRK